VISLVDIDHIIISLVDWLSKYYIKLIIYIRTAYLIDRSVYW